MMMVVETEACWSSSSNWQSDFLWFLFYNLAASLSATFCAMNETAMVTSGAKNANDVRYYMRILK